MPDDETTTDPDGTTITLDRPVPTGMVRVITAAGTEDLPSGWHAILTVEGLRTTDHRSITVGALSWRQLPFAIFSQINNAGHFDAPIVGQVTSIDRQDVVVEGVTLHCVVAEGTFDFGDETLPNEDGMVAARMCRDQVLRWGSIDLEVLESTIIEVITGEPTYDPYWDEYLPTTDWWEEITSGRIMGYTMVPMPAFPQAVCAPLGVNLEPPAPMGEATNPLDTMPGLLASGMTAIPVEPPKWWFDMPADLEPDDGITVTDDGRVYGWLAKWGECHVGMPGICTEAPKSPTDYAFFKTGTIKTETGDLIRCGRISMSPTLDVSGHAEGTLNWKAAAAHYDNVCTAVADVNIGETDYGIWVAGAMRPTQDKRTPEEVARILRASMFSGDWRDVGGELDLLAAAVVNTGGFQGPGSRRASSIVASAGAVYGKDHKPHQVSLVAAGRVLPPSPARELARRIAALESIVGPLRGLAAKELARQVNG